MRLLSSSSVRVCGLPSASGLYMPTETASWGTKPENQIDFASEEVPVLPATGRSSCWSLVAVPPGLTV